MNDPVVLRDQRGPVRWLRLNRPGSRNALDPRLIDDLDEELSAAEADPNTLVLVIAGAGPSFCAGADLRHLLELSDAGHDPLDFLSCVSALFSRLECSRLPVIAAVHGHAVAGGLELALACDVVVAAEDALLGDGHVRNQLLPAGGGSVRLPRRVGPSLARYLLLTGELLHVDRFRDAGWLHTVVPASQLDETVQRVAEELAGAGGPAQSRIKPLLAELDDMTHSEALGVELDTFAKHWEAVPVGDALRSFLAVRAEAGRR